MRQVDNRQTQTEIQAKMHLRLHIVLVEVEIGNGMNAICNDGQQAYRLSRLRFRNY